ncbi:hypothetical protein PHJA_000503800 [Phtheirospermum japonicum]|uniref:UspA domain-containing protein n=1 Tax=Phtheirospermum japonicum TaxID=374723 RepID=A0A830BFQ6_9LAMI|nr:hypothetical protein PHJA_000503800 [Phtheirospermum japonicum]
MEKIIVVVEDVEVARTALQWALHNILRCGDVLTLVHVYSASPSRNKNKLRRLRLKGFQLALSFMDICHAFPNTKTEIVVTEGDQDGRRIAAIAREIGASTLVLGLHDRSFLYGDVDLSLESTASLDLCEAGLQGEPGKAPTKGNNYQFWVWKTCLGQNGEWLRATYQRSGPKPEKMAQNKRDVQNDSPENIHNKSQREDLLGKANDYFECGVKSTGKKDREDEKSCTILKTVSNDGEINGCIKDGDTSRDDFEEEENAKTWSVELVSLQTSGAELEHMGFDVCIEENLNLVNVTIVSQCSRVPLKDITSQSTLDQKMLKRNHKAESVGMSSEKNRTWENGNMEVYQGTGKKARTMPHSDQDIQRWRMLAHNGLKSSGEQEEFGQSYEKERMQYGEKACMQCS